MPYASGETPQVGDKVVCIKPDVDEYLTKGQVYKVEARNNFNTIDEVFLEKVLGSSWKLDRFKLVERASVQEEEKIVEPSPLHLHLGCYHKKIHGFVNIDVRSEVNPDITDDCVKLTKIRNNSVDLIYTSHMLEHTTRNDSIKALERYYEVLKSGGEIYISVPDLEMVFRHYILHQDLRLLQNFLYGSQKHIADLHYNGWDFKTLREDLESVGFKNVEKYDTWKTSWSHIDDYSKAYLPHMDFENGVLMSLNVRATK